MYQTVMPHAGILLALDICRIAEEKVPEGRRLLPDLGGSHVSWTEAQEVARCGYAQALPDFIPTLNEVIKMEKMTRKKVLRAAKSSGYRPVLSTGVALGVRSPALKGAAKVECLPQWKGYGRADAVLSKRSLSVDIGMSDIQLDDVISTADLVDKLREGTDAYRATHALSC